MLSLRQVQSADVSNTRADEYARSKEFSLANSDFRGAFKFLVAFRLLAVVTGLSLSLFGAQMAMAQLFGACLLYIPTHHYLAINTLLVAVPALIFSLFSVVREDTSPKHQLITTCISEALVVSLAALALRFNCQPMIVIVLTVAALALGNCAFVKATIKMVPLFPEVKTFTGFNGYFCAFGICSVLAAVLLVKTISFALPGGLEIAASIILLGCAMVFKAMPESNYQYVQEQRFLAALSPLLPFLVPASMTAIPVFTVLLLTLERNWVLFPHLMHIFQIVCIGAIVGFGLSVPLTARRFQLSQLCLPALAALALSFIMAISPAANQGLTADVCLAILGALFVYSNVQLLTRAQISFSPIVLAQSARLISICAIFAVSLFVISLEPFLDTISATMVVRFLGLEIGVAGSVALSAVLIFHNRSVGSVNIRDSGDKNAEQSHDFWSSGVVSRGPAE
jgi:hypothetical protein